jgi:arsenate reductase-like glutaredoxin family protein
MVFAPTTIAEPSSMGQSSLVRKASSRLEMLHAELVTATIDSTDLRGQFYDVVPSDASAENASRSEIDRMIKQLGEVTEELRNERREQYELTKAIDAASASSLAQRDLLTVQLSTAVAQTAELSKQVAVLTVAQESLNQSTAASEAADHATRMECEILHRELLAVQAGNADLERQLASRQQRLLVPLLCGVAAPGAPFLIPAPRYMHHEWQLAVGRSPAPFAMTAMTAHGMEGASRFALQRQHYSEQLYDPRGSVRRCNRCRRVGHRARDCPRRAVSYTFRGSRNPSPGN